MEDINLIIGKRLEYLRTLFKPGLNKGEFAKEIGMPVSTYTDYEAGRRGLSNEKLLFFADYYDISADYLLGRTASNHSKITNENKGK